MLKVSVVDSHAEGDRFDMDHYAKTQMPMVRERIGAALTGISIDRGSAGSAAAPYFALALITTHYAHGRHIRHR